MGRFLLLFSFYLAFNVFEKKKPKDDNNVALNHQEPIAISILSAVCFAIILGLVLLSIHLKRKARVMPPPPRSGPQQQAKWAVCFPLISFYLAFIVNEKASRQVLEMAWDDTVTAETRLFTDSNTEISYAILPSFPKSETVSLFKDYNAVMKRIQMPKNDHYFAQQVDQELKTLEKMNKGRPFEFDYGMKDDKIVYMALTRSDRNFFTRNKGNEKFVDGLQQNMLKELFKLGYQEA